MTKPSAATLQPRPHRAPWPLILVAVAAVCYILGPMVALLTRVPWGRLGDALSSADTASLLWVSLWSSVEATAITVLLGVPLALCLQYLRRGALIARGLVLLPLAMPPVVAGLALTAAVGRQGLAQPILDLFGIQLAFAFPGVVASHVFVCLPFVVVTVDSALRHLDGEISASARSVGMSDGEIVRRITLPTIAPALATGAGLAFARSLGEFGTTLTFAGSMPGVTRTMPLGIYLIREVDQEAAYALSALLIGLAIACLTLASIPALLRRSPKPRPRTIHPLDAAALERLTTPRGSAMAIDVQTAGAPLRFSSGHTTSVVGPNGSGKTTLMKTIAGRIRGPEVSYGDAGTSADAVPAPGMVVMLTQNPGLPPRASAAQAITMVTRSSARTHELLEAAGLQELADVRVPALSGGQAAQIALVRALAARPRVLILDEPLSAIDASSAARWRRLLRAGAHTRTTLLVTHDATDIHALADEVATMEHGRVVSTVPVAEFRDAPPTAFAAGLVGHNVISGAVLAVKDAAEATTANGAPCRRRAVTLGLRGAAAPNLELAGYSIDSGIQAGDVAWASFTPQAVHPVDTVALSSTSEQNLIRGTVVAIEDLGAQAKVTLECGEYDITVLLSPHNFSNFSQLFGTTIDCQLMPNNLRVERSQ